jgi:hypothetical protein
MLRIRSEAWGKRSLPQVESAEFAGCEALRAEQSANGIRSIVAGREASGNNICLQPRRH